MKEIEIDREMEIIYERVKKAIQDISSDIPIPTVGILRLINGIMINHWAKFARAQREEMGSSMDSEKFDFIRSMLHNLAEAHAKDEDHDQQISMSGTLDMDKGEIRIPNHTITIDQAGKVLAHHDDGESCDLDCPFCWGPDLYVKQIDGEHYVYCRTCQSKTNTFSNPYIAIIHWLTGDVKERSE